MSALQTSPINLDLDLAFHPANDDALTSLVDADTKRRLTHASPWQQDLTAWIASVRRDPTLTCPEIVRLSPMLSLGLQLTDDATITELNHAWRQRSESTDVLSFPALDNSLVLPTDTCVELGDIVVSVQTAQRQAKQHSHELGLELRWLVSHGLLHLLGWDHPTDQSLKTMLSYQEQLLSINGKVHHH